MALPTKRGFTARLKEDDCGQAEDELPLFLPPPASLCQISAPLASKTQPLQYFGHDYPAAYDMSQRGRAGGSV